MRYVALLRGINVGGKSKVPMNDLKATFEKAGYTNVSTYINSGNVVFSTDDKDQKKLTATLEELLTKTFGFDLTVVIRSQAEIDTVITNVPIRWNDGSDVRCYVGFLTDNATDEMIAEIPMKEGIDSLKILPGVIYMTTKMEGLTKSYFSKMSSKKIYKQVTIRNYNTTKKIASLF